MCRVSAARPGLRCPCSGGRSRNGLAVWLRRWAVVTGSSWTRTPPATPLSRVRSLVGSGPWCPWLAPSPAFRSPRWVLSSWNELPPNPAPAQGPPALLSMCKGRGQGPAPSPPVPRLPPGTCRRLSVWNLPWSAVHISGGSQPGLLRSLSVNYCPGLRDVNPGLRVSWGQAQLRAAV